MYYKKKQSLSGSFLVGCIALVAAVLCANITSQSIKITDDKKQITTELIQKVTENESLKFEVGQLKTPAVSRGEYEYLKPVVITSINKYLNGLLKDKGEVYYTSGKSKHVNPMLMAAISIHETANGTSVVLKKYNNVAGINWTGDKTIKHQGRYTVFKDIDDSINNLAYILDNHYIRQNRISIEAIGAKFCPIDDPDNGKWGMENSTWIPNVTKIYTKILEEVKGVR